MGSTGSLRREVLQLYREIVRTTKVFAGLADSNGRDYAAVLTLSARKEIEAARTIESREEIYKRLVVGRDALHQIHDKVSVWRSCTDAVCFIANLLRMNLNLTNAFPLLTGTDCGKAKVPA